MVAVTSNGFERPFNLSHLFFTPLIVFKVRNGNKLMIIHRVVLHYHFLIVDNDFKLAT